MVCRLRDKNILLLRNMEIRYCEVRLTRFDIADISASIIAFYRIPSDITFIVLRNYKKITYGFFFYLLFVASHWCFSWLDIKVVYNYFDYYRNHKTVDVPLSVYHQCYLLNYTHIHYLMRSLLRFLNEINEYNPLF